MSVPNQNLEMFRWMWAILEAIGQSGRLIQLEQQFTLPLHCSIIRVTRTFSSTLQAPPSLLWPTEISTKVGVSCKISRNKLLFILSGEEVTENYFPLYTHAEKIARQSWLLDHYNFHCRCIACIGNYKLRSELQKEKDPPWRCLVCHELILADNFYCCKKSKGEAEMKNLLDEVMTEIEQIKANVNQLDGQASSISELKQQKLIFLKSFQRLCDLVGPNCEQFLGSHEFFKALLNKLFGNNGITPDR